MPAPELAFQWEGGVLWPAVGPDRNGQMAVTTTPQPIRWRLNRTRSEAVSPDGNVVQVDMTAVVAQRIDVDSVMWFGSVSQVPQSGLFNGPEGPLPELLLVKTYTEVPDVKARFRSRTIGLMRLKGALPTQVPNT